MSRHGYDDYGDGDQWATIMWNANLGRAVKGKRGQAFLRELVAALDALPEKRLISENLQIEPPAFVPPGEAQKPMVCAIGSIGLKRGIDMKELDPERPKQIAKAFRISSVMVREIEYQNDDGAGYYRLKDETPEERWTRVREWAASQIKGGEA